MPDQKEQVRSTTSAEKEAARVEAAMAAVKDMKLTEEKPPEEAQASAADAPAGEAGQSETSGDSPSEQTEASASTPEAPEEKDQEKRITDKLAEMARRDRDLRAREQAIKQQQRTLQDFGVFADKIKTDPMGALLSIMERSGVDNSVLLDQLSNITGNEQIKSAIKDPEIEELKRWKREEVQRREQEEQRRAYQSELSNIHRMLQQNPDRWETILDQVDDGSLARVFETLDRVYRDTGELPTEDTYRDVADAVEKVLLEDERKRLEKWSKSKRHGKTIVVGDKPKQSPAPVAPQKQTLTSELQREAPQRKAPKNAEERLALAMEQARQFKWTDDD